MEAQREGWWHWRVPQAGNLALCPCLISSDCKICAVLLYDLRALQKEGRGRGEEHSAEEKTIIFTVTIF